MERREEILQHARRLQRVRITELAKVLDAHVMTVRRDLRVLIAQGHLEHIRGGGRLPSQAEDESTYDIRRAFNKQAKVKIAQAAMSLIEPGDTVAFDASTTTLEVQERLTPETGTVVVAGLDGANLIADSDLDFLLLGGVFHPPTRSFVCGETHSPSYRIYPSKVFFSAKGFTARAGFTDTYQVEAETKRALISSARLRVCLLDFSKFGRIGPETIVHADSVDVLITDREPPKWARETLKRNWVRLIVVLEEERGGAQVEGS